MTIDSEDEIDVVNVSIEESLNRDINISGERILNALIKKCKHKSMRNGIAIHIDDEIDTVTGKETDAGKTGNSVIGKSGTSDDRICGATMTNHKNKPNYKEIVTINSSSVVIDDVSDQDIFVDVVNVDTSHDDHIHKSIRTTISNRQKNSNLVNRQICEHCCKQIYTHNPVIACPTCPLIIHSKCVANGNFIIGDGSGGCSKWYCKDCYETQGIKRYNPFFECIEMDPMHRNDDEAANNNMECILEISTMLQNCNPYSIEELNSKVRCDTANQFSTFFLNIDGNATNFDQFVAELQLYQTTFSVIALAETNIDQCNGNMYQIDNYQSIYQSNIVLNEKVKSKGSGIGMYIHNTYNFTEIPQVSRCTPNIEALFITITNTATPITIGVVYRPPSGDVDIFNAEFEQLVNQLPNKNVYIHGDFNINLHKTDKNTTAFEKVFISNGYAPLISLATHERPHCEPSCIDNIFCNNINHITCTGTITDKLSHHLPIFSFSNIESINKNSSEKADSTPQYDFCNANAEKFVDRVKSVFSTSPENNYNFSGFAQAYTNLIDECCLSLSKSKSKRTKTINPWITPSIIRSVQTKHKLYKAWKKTVTKNDAVGNPEKYYMYKNYRRRLKTIIKSAKKLHYCKKFDESKGDIKKTWKLINDLRGKCNKSPPASFIINSKLILDRRIIASEFNAYFTSIATKMNESVLSDGIPIHGIPDFISYMPTRIKDNIFLEDCSSYEIEKIISEFENSKSSDIPINLLKKSSKLISPILAYFFNQFMDQGIFPDELKIGQVVPVYKKGNKEELQNYRPISILPAFSKIFEKIIYYRLYSFLSANNVISDTQFGFRKGHSTSHALNYSIEKIYGHLEASKHVIGIFIDLSKAFDTIDHNQLLYKIENYGFRGKAFDLIKSYMTNRNQFVQFLDEKSNLAPIRYGVPQGSVLGPLLFLLYINDIVNATPCGDFVLYADDTNIFVAANSREGVYEKANEVLNYVYNYMLSNKLHINMSKCNYMYFRPNIANYQVCARSREMLKLSINGKNIKQVASTKFLGVIIDEDLSWIPHVEYLNKKLKSCCGAIKRIMNYIPDSQFVNIYHSLFESHLSYCISVWGGASPVEIEKLFITQKYCMRILFGKQPYWFITDTCQRALSFNEQMNRDYSKEHTKPLFKSNDILTVSNLYNYHALTELYKIMKFRTPCSIYSKLHISDRKILLILNKVKFDKHKQQFFYNAALKWNQIYNFLIEPYEIKLINSEHTDGSSFDVIITYDFTLSVSVLKAKLKKIIMAIQCDGIENEWATLNSNLTAYTGIVNTHR